MDTTHVGIETNDDKDYNRHNLPILKSVYVGGVGLEKVVHAVRHVSIDHVVVHHP